MSNIDKLNEKNVDLILAFHGANAKLQAKTGVKGIKISHQDCVNMAVHHYNSLTHRGYKGFKIELNKYQAQKTKNQSIEIAIDNNEFYKQVAAKKSACLNTFHKETNISHHYTPEKTSCSLLRGVFLYNSVY